MTVSKAKPTHGNKITLNRAIKSAQYSGRFSIDDLTSIV